MCACCPWFRGLPPRSAVAHCARWPLSSLLYSTAQRIPGVSKPPKRWVLGKGGARVAKVRKEQKMGDFMGEDPFYWCSAGGPSGSVGFRGGPLCPYAHSPSHRTYSRSADQYQAFQNHRNVGHWGRGEKRRNDTRKSGKRVKNGFAGAIEPFVCVPWGSAVVRCARPPINQSPLSPLCRHSDKWEAFRNHRNVRYWEMEEERRKREEEKRRNA